VLGGSDGDEAEENKEKELHLGQKVWDTALRLALCSRELVFLSPCRSPYSVGHRPPATLQAWPVMFRAPGPARNRAMAAMSSGL